MILHCRCLSLMLLFHHRGMVKSHISISFISYLQEVAMNIEELEFYLHRITKSEQWHLDHPGELSPFYNKLTTQIHKGEQCYFFDFVNTLKNDEFAVVKETRFATIPLHYHKDMEMNYVYEGSCTFMINQKEVVLEKGDLCILESDVHHSATSVKNEDDIIINFVFRKSYFTNSFLNRLSDKGLITRFLLNAISQSHKQDKYLIFKTANNFRFHMIIQLLLCEYYAPSISYDELNKTYMALVFLELINTIHDTGTVVSDSYKNDEQIISILKYIEENFDTCTLKDVAKAFNFNPNYVGNLIKKKTGSTFQELKLSQQLSVAANLLRSTDKTVLDIMAFVGCSNPSYFYRKFKESFHLSPKSYRSKEDSHA